jgi:aspartyl-tRNA synthetase
LRFWPIKDRVLNHANTPPFTIEEDTDGGEDLRMKYRYLDLRRPVLRRNSGIALQGEPSVRNYLMTQGLWDIETPFLIKSTTRKAHATSSCPLRMNEGSSTRCRKVRRPLSSS